MIPDRKAGGRCRGLLAAVLLLSTVIAGSMLAAACGGGAPAPPPGKLVLGPNEAEVTVSAQAPTDVPHLFHFYQSYFRRQGSFPVYERVLS